MAKRIERVLGAWLTMMMPPSKQMEVSNPLALVENVLLSMGLADLQTPSWREEAVRLPLCCQAPGTPVTTVTIQPMDKNRRTQFRIVQEPNTAKHPSEPGSLPPFRGTLHQHPPRPKLRMESITSRAPAPHHAWSHALWANRANQREEKRSMSKLWLPNIEVPLAWRPRSPSLPITETTLLHFWAEQ